MSQSLFVFPPHLDHREMLKTVKSMSCNKYIFLARLMKL